MYVLPYSHMLLIAIAAFFCSGIGYVNAPLDWGFYAHKEINKLAVFCLPARMLPLYKQHIKYISEHAVDADKRRYATRHEAVRHYIDLDQWGVYPFEDLPRVFPEALARYTLVLCQQDSNSTDRDTLASFVNDSTFLFVNASDSLVIPQAKYHDFFRTEIYAQYYEENWHLSDRNVIDSMGFQSLGCARLKFVDQFSEHGILPYHLLQAYARLRNAFQAKDLEAILRYSADIGHYVGDAHVPLHTTKNYNGQLTDQDGIHAFWESRVPELFAEDTYDLLTGRASYIRNPADYFWQMVEQSHLRVDSVLEMERLVSELLPANDKYCYTERNGIMVRTYCEAFARAYQDALNGMIERRMRATIHAVASVWYSAWVDAGQPDLRAIANNDILVTPIDVPGKGNPIGRSHAN